MGAAHAGHDQCAHCYFQYIKPALQAERAAVKRRKELKRLHLSAENRALISEVDLKEPQMVDHPDPPPKPISIRRAVSDVLIDQMLEGKTERQQLETVINEVFKEEIRDILPLPIRPVQPVKYAPKEEPPVQNTEPKQHSWLAKAPPAKQEMPASDQPPNFRPPLTLEERQEVIDAYVAGMTISEIMRAYNVGTTRLYEVLDDAGVPRRGPNRVPPKEPAMPQSTPPVSPPKVEPAPSNGVVSGLTEWVVTYTVTRTETTIVAAKSFQDAATRAWDYHTEGNVEILSVAKKLP